MSHESPRESVEAPNRWIGPLALLAVIVVPIVILVFSNTESATVSWAGFDWEAPLWLVLAATFVAGAVGSRVFGWLWRQWRRRRRRLASEAEVVRRRTDDSGE